MHLRCWANCGWLATLSVALSLSLHPKRSPIVCVHVGLIVSTLDVFAAHKLSFLPRILSVLQPIIYLDLCIRWLCASKVCFVYTSACISTFYHTISTYDVGLHICATMYVHTSHGWTRVLVYDFGVYVYGNRARRNQTYM